MNPVEIYTKVLVVIVSVLAPLSVVAAAFLWSVHREDRRIDERRPKPLLRLSLVLSINGTVTALVAVYFLVLVLYRVFVGPTADWVASVSGTVVVALEAIPLLTAVYLASLRRRNWRTSRKRRPPPWDPTD